MAIRCSAFFLPCAALLSAALAGCNAAPIAPVVSIEPNAPSTLDDFELVFLARSEDPDLADTVTYNIQWYRTTDEGEEAMIDLDGAMSVPSELTAKNELWQVLVTPIDSEGLVGQGAEAVITVQNTAPTVSVDLLPKQPASYEDVTARPASDDVDGDPVTYTYTWLRNGEVVDGLSGNVLPATETDKGDVWTVQVVPSDGQIDGEPAEASVSIGNALPLATGVELQPTVVREDTLIQATPAGTDEDGDALTWTFTWYVNDEDLGPGVGGDTLDGTHFDKGDRVVVEAIPNDGLADGEGVRSAPVLVRNSAPTLGGAAITPAEAYEASTLSCVGSGFADIDGDPEGYEIVWFVNGARLVQSTVDGGDFSKDDAVYCELSPFDGAEAGDFVRTDTITILNTPPVLARVTITNPSPREGDVLEARIDGAGDDDGDTVTFEYTWTVDGVAVATTPTLSSDLFDKGDQVQVSITPFDGEDRGRAVSSASVTVDNTPPVMGSVTLSPTDLRTLDTLAASVTASDVDGDTITYDFAWYVDGVRVSASGKDLDGASWFDKGEEVYVVVTPNDGEEDGASITSAAVEVKNTKPEITSATVSPSTAQEETLLTCVPAGWSDDDADTEIYEYVWYVDSKKVGVASTLDGDFFDRGDQVWCEITPFDGEERGTARTSAKVSIDNTAPSIAKVELSSATPAEGDTVYAVVIGDTDVDGDTISFSYAWYVDGTQVSTADEIDSTLFGKGDSIYVVVTPDDGTDDGAPVTSNVGKVANTAPVISAVSLSPSSPATTDGITATVTASDVDGDSLTYRYAWYVDGTKASATSATLPSSSFVKNQDIYVEVIPNDGDDDGVVYKSSAVRSVNTVPSITGVSVVPGTGITEVSTLTCTPAGWSDADLDAEGYAWQWRVDGKLVAVTKTLTGTFFGRGDAITCTATPNDGEGLGTARTSAAVRVANTPPTLASVTLSTTSPREDDTLSATLGAATDVDGDRITYSYSWEVNGVEVSTAPTLSGSDFDKDDTIELYVTPSDGTDAGTAVSSGVVTALNTLPVISTVTLSPTSPKTTDAISATVSSSDADGDRVTYTYAWTVNGTAATATGALLPATSFSKGDSIAVTVTPADDDGSGTAASSSAIKAVNTAPVLGSVSLTPSSFGETDTVTCTPGAYTDADGDTAIYSYAWKVNGSTVSPTTATLSGTNFGKSDTVQCVVTPNDGSVNGAAVSSAVVTVGNSPPTLASAAISPASPKEKDVLTVTLGTASDPDGDTISYTYAWTVGGTVVATTSTLTGSDFDRGDSISVTVTPSDGTDSGTAVASPAVKAVNTAPVVAAVSLAPTSPGTDSTLVATVTASDDDGDAMTYSYDWYVGGSKVSATGSSLDGKVHFDKGDSVYVVVTADDGTDTSAATTSASVTVGNTAPSIASAAISPTTIREATTVSCTATGWSDADGDTEGYVYQWTVNGGSVATTATLTGSSFKKGDRIGCRLTPDDGTSKGIPVNATSIKVLNTAPVLDSVSLSSLSPSESDTLTATLGSASDADGDTITYRYAWYVNGTLASSATSLTSTYFSSGDTIYLEVTPEDGDDSGTAVKSATATVSNTGPTITSVTLAPASPKTNDLIKASTVASDPDGDPLTYTYTWKVNGVAVSGVSGNTLSGVSHFDKGESVTVDVAVSDGTTTLTATSAAVTVANTVPKVSEAKISATSVKEGDTLTCTPGRWSDADGDSAAYKYAWLRGTTVIAGETGNTLTSAAFDRGDVVRCQITPWDGDDDGTAVLSPTATVQNTAPVLASASLTPTSPQEGSTISVVLGSATDADGDAITYSYAWTVNGSSISHTGSSLTGAWFSKGDSIAVTVTPSDGTDAGSAVTSAAVSAVNTPPVVSTVSLSPSVVYTTNPITASVTASDADGDALTYTYSWYIQDEGTGSYVKHSTAGAVLPASALDKADKIYVTVVAQDGTASSAGVDSPTITVQNSAPGAPGTPGLTPTAPTDKNNLVCSWTAGSDIDGDSITYEVQWRRNSSTYATYTTSSTSYTLPASATKGGETWSCRTRTRDVSGAYSGWTSYSPGRVVKSTCTPVTLNFDNSSERAAWSTAGSWGFRTYCKYTGTYGLCYGNGSNYGGTANFRARRTFTVPSNADKLLFRWRYQPDPGEYGSFDRFQVQFGGTSLVDHTAGSHPTPTWRQHSYTIPSSWYGTSRSFDVYFHTQDSVLNNGWGAGVDQIQVTCKP